MPTARTQALITGREIYIEVDKSATETPEWVTVGCAKSINYNGAKEILTANCQSGKKKVASGDDPDYTVSISGFVFFYATADVATNVSHAEFEGWMNAGIMKKYRIASAKTGDPIRTFPGIISSCDLTDEVYGLAEYSVSITASTKPVITAQA